MTQDTTNEEDGVVGVDLPAYGRNAVDAQIRGRPLPPMAEFQGHGGTSANDTQIGGTHYKGTDYQHWDFVCDTRMPYLLGCATKYVARHADKGGFEDLQKSVHYMDKAWERGITMPPHQITDLEKFVCNLGPWESRAVRAVCYNDYETFQRVIAEMVILYYDQPAAEAE